mgnify:CR=1 FL=1
MKKDGRGPGTKLKTACLLLLAAAVLLGLYQGGRWLETRGNHPEPRGNYQDRKADEAVVTYNGTAYRQRKSLTSILLMGIDHASGEKGGQADFLQLLVIDDSERTVQRLPIDRDTMTPITVLGVLGNRSGVRTAQISLSHGFGDGQAESCELTAEAVSNLLLGSPVDFYSGLLRLLRHHRRAGVGAGCGWPAGFHRFSRSGGACRKAGRAEPTAGGRPAAN